MFDTLTTGQLEDIAGLVIIWRNYISKNPAQHGPLDPHARYLAGLGICADQLEEIVNRIRQNAEV